MRALAKDPEQRYATAEEMDADLARVARGLAVSQKTEEAMTQVLAGAGVAGATTAATMVNRPSTAAPPAPPPPPYRRPGYYDYDRAPRRRTIWPWILGVLAAAIAAGAGYLLYDRIQERLDENAPVAVIDVGSIQRELAIRNLREQGFKVRVVRIASPTVPLDAVIRQDPLGGEPTARGSTVTIWVSTGKPKVTVPDVRNHSSTDAVATLTRAGLEPVIHELNSLEPEGTITAQNPPPGAVVLKGSRVHINVSQGPRQESVPNVVGQWYANAASALQGAGFDPERVNVDDPAPKGQVVAQDPSAGALARPGSTVTLTVSNGPADAVVPEVAGLVRADAEALVREAGFEVSVFTQDVTDPGQDGLVLAADPPAGERLEQGATVTLLVGTLVAPTQPPPPPPPPPPPAAAPTTTPATTTPTETAPPTSTTP
jgi:serine/threonine-protein kinase